MSHIEFLNVTPSEMQDYLRTSLLTDRPTMIWGSYGVGKTSIIRELGHELGFDSTIVLTPSTDDVIDYRYPYVVKEESGETVSKFAVSELFPRTGRHLIFVDEINTADTILQPQLYGLMLEGKIGHFHLPKECRRIAAGNREWDQCAAKPMSAALKNRMTHLNLQVNAEEWKAWAFREGIEPLVISFVNEYPQYLEGNADVKAPNVSDTSGGCTPRSLHALSDLIKAGMFNKSDKIIRAACSGTIGESVGAAFMGHKIFFDSNVKIGDILANPKKVPINDKSDVLYSIVCSLVHIANKDNFKTIHDYIDRLTASHQMMFWQSYISAKRVDANQFSPEMRALYSRFFQSQGQVAYGSAFNKSC